jgi:hypothetical protein
MRKGKEQNIELLLDEMILGPVDNRPSQAFPRDDENRIGPLPAWAPLR